jgi:hypothetical protein
VTGRARACVALQGLAAAALGVLLGASVMEGAVLVTWWREIPPAAFLTWYAANAGRLLGFFAPLTTVAIVLAVVAAIVSLALRDGGRRWAALAAALAVLAAIGFFVYFEDVNASFAAGSIPVDAVPAALAGWARWHWVRVAVLGASFVASLGGLVRRDPIGPARGR